MLKVLLYYKKENGIYPILSKFGFKLNEDHYIRELKADSFIVKAIHNNTAKVVEFSCKDEVSYDGCKEMHEMITHIAENLNAKIDDSDAMLGYNAEGNPTYLVHGFQSWSEFLDQAGHRSLEGHKVECFDGKVFLGKGIFISSDMATKDINENPKIPSCTIISSEGEETFLGDKLKIIPVSD
ncbi:hypothetical protein [Salipaludibacillus daqingensis]|uniref:hypothetical protein n=1 Tax=Salipaludibacillus daqingensis TaxID=3041001 RepID=UPI002472ED35|nr:hypothetical protein [Salipaludibacillus daqingensis]